MSVIGMTSGVWDLIHYGHTHFLKRCRQQCDVLIVGVDCDKMVRKTKGPGRPIISSRERRLMVQSLKCVTLAFVLEDLSQLKDLSVLFGVSKVFKNNPFLEDIRPVFGVHETSAELIILPDVEELPETTNLLNQIKAPLVDQIRTLTLERDASDAELQKLDEENQRLRKL